jgi:hypothetical protein
MRQYLPLFTNFDVHLKMLLPELKVHLLARSLLTRHLDIPRRNTGPAKVHTHLRPQRALQPIHIGTIQNAIAHATQQAREIRASKVRATLELGEGIFVGTDGVEHNVLRGVDVHFLRQVRVDAQELVAVGPAGLCFERGEEGLEPLEGRRVLAHPDELDAAQALGRVGRQAQVVDGLEDGRPGRNADTGTNQDGNFVLEDVFGGRAVGAVNLERGHLLAVLEGDFVHAHGVELVVEFGLGLSGAEGVGEGAREVADLADVHGNVGVVGARGDRKGVPLVVADFRAVEEEPLAWLVLHAGLGELDLDGVFGVLAVYCVIVRGKLTVWMTNNLDNLGLAPAANLTVQTVGEVETTTYKLPSPALVTDAVRPEVLLVEGREGGGSVTDEAAGSVRVHAEQERDEEVVSVPKGLERLLAYPGMGSRVDQQHAEQHDMAGDTTSFGVVNLESDLRSYLDTFDVEEAVVVSPYSVFNIRDHLLDVMSTGMQDREEQHRVGDLTMEPL